MAYASISKPSLHMNPKLYTGTGSSQGITGVGFQPDWTWIKDRDNSTAQLLFDAVRGAGKRIQSNNTDAEATNNQQLSSFNSDGFTVGTNGDANGNSANFVSWNWKANGAGSSNSDGSLTSTVSVNTTAGFSIVKFVNNTSYTASTFGHGLGAVPKMIIMKSLDDAYNWDVYHEKVGATKRLVLNSNAAEGSTSGFNNTAPTNQVFTLKSNHYGNGSEAIAYCFTNKKGYSKIDSYIGNGSTNGTFIYTGFKPAWVMIKNADANEQWRVYDSTREPSNRMFKCLFPNADSAENTTDNASEEIDFLSNGIKIRSSAAQLNGSGNELIYMAFAEEPLVANVGASIPATAR